MKVADLFGAGVPVCALDYGARLAERVRHGDNGLLFSTAGSWPTCCSICSRRFPPTDQTFERLRSGARKSARRRGTKAGCARRSRCCCPRSPRMLVVRGRRIVVPGGERPASIHIDGGRIVAVGDVDAAAPAGAEVVDSGNLVVSPGVVDSHVHVNEPGRAEWEGFDTATRAAAAGGVTTIVDMPLNSVPATTTVGGLRRQTATRRAAAVMLTWRVGAASCPATRTRSMRWSTRASAASSAFSSRRASTSFLTSTRRRFGARCRFSRDEASRLLVHAELPQRLVAHAGRVRVVSRLRGDPSGGRGSRRDSPDGKTGPRDRCAGPHRPRVVVRQASTRLPRRVPRAHRFPAKRARTI